MSNLDMGKHVVCPSISPADAQAIDASNIDEHWKCDTLKNTLLSERTNVDSM